MIKSRGISWADHAIHTGEIINGYIHFVGKPNGNNYLAELGHKRRVVLKLIFKK
jgi:hypothetical protein